MVEPNNKRQPDTGPGSGSLYVAADFFVLRAPILPADTLDALAEGSDSLPTETSEAWLANRRAEGRRRLRPLTQSLRVRQAIHVASPSVSASLREMGREVADGARPGSAFLRYLTRMSTRATPHGLFAGVAQGTFASEAKAALEEDPVKLTRTRPDMGWLRAVMREIEAEEESRELLPVCVNDLAYEAGGRLILFRPDSTPGHAGDRAEIRLTRAVVVALRLAARNLTYGQLLAGVAAEFPKVSRQKIRNLIDQLWDSGVILCALQPRRTSPRPDQSLVEQLDKHSVRSEAVKGLADVSRLLAEVDARPGAVDTAVLDKLVASQRALTPGHVGQTYRLDTALAAEVELPQDIATEAAAAAEILMRLGCVSPRPVHIVNYHHRFVEAYGMDSELPLLDVLRSETGIGPPSTYELPPRHLPLPWSHEDTTMSAKRDRALTELVAHSSRHELTEVELTDDWFAGLTVWSPDDPRCAPRTSLDLYLHIAAHSVDAINDGQWRIVLGTFGYNGGLHSVGRFFDLLDDSIIPKMRSHLREEERLQPDAMFAELNYAAPDWFGFNVSIHPDVRKYEVSVNAPPNLAPDRQISLEDILLGANSTNFYLRSASRGKRLVVSQAHALSSMFAPNECRALLEFSGDGFTATTRFDWGVLSDAPALPRLTRGRIVVSPARWTISKRTFASSYASLDEFFHACQEWRVRWRVPRHVYLTDFDNRLLLDLEHPLGVDELLRVVRRCERQAWQRNLTVDEMLPDADGLWLRDRAGRRYHSELTVPLRLGEPHKDLSDDRSRLPESSQGVTRRWMPGGEWVHLKLYSALELHDAIIGGPLLSLLSELKGTGLAEQWFYIRYADPLAHLRLRFRVAAADRAGELLLHCAAWGRRLVEEKWANDLTFASYDREVERYGGSHAIESLENVFFRNSEVSAELVRLAHTRPSEFDMEILCVAAMQNLLDAWGRPPSSDRRSAQALSRLSDANRKRFRQLRPLLCEVLAPGESRPDPRSAAYKTELGPIFSLQYPEVQMAAKSVRRLAECGLLAGSEDRIVESLIHMQANRLLGADGERERNCFGLWGMAQRAIRGRPAKRSQP
ncbi:lantibiotic dehydratase [Nonomuraea diastatica]|nr:lantibiotic dehydratase [Nonomuraea diastatica]